MRVEVRKNTRHHQCRIEFDWEDDPMLDILADEPILEYVAWSVASARWFCTCNDGQSDEQMVRLPHCEHFRILGIRSSIDPEQLRIRTRALRLQALGDFDFFEELERYDR